MRISNSEAQKQAVELAEAFLSVKGTSGFTCKYVGASPDLMADDVKHRKTYVKWSVVK